jgi:hypothetical protein
MNQLYLRLKYGYADEKCDYELYRTESGYRLEKNYYFSKKGTLKELKDFLRKVYKIWYKQQQKRIAEIIGEPYSSPLPMVNVARYL